MEPCPLNSLTPRKRAAVLCLATAVYFVAGKIGLGLAIIHPNASAVWPPTGIALAAFLWFGLDLWPAILAGAFLVNLTTSGTVLTSFGIALGNTLEGAVAALLIQRYASGVHSIERSYDLFKFVVFAALISTTLSATIGVTVLVVGGLAQWEGAGSIWLTWWMGDAMGALLIAPLLLLWGTHPRLNWTRRQVFEAPLLFGALCWVALAGFCGWYSTPMLAHALRVFCIPVVIWAAFRFGTQEAATASIFLCALAIWGTHMGRGPFSMEKSPNDALLRLQMFMGMVTVLGMSVGIEVTERKRSARALIQANEQLERRVSERTASLTEAVAALQNQIAARNQAEESFRRILDSNIIGFMVVDMEGKVLDANNAFLDALGYTRKDLAAGLVGGPALTAPGYQAMDEWARTRLRDKGYCPPFEKAYVRKDGSLWPVLVGVVQVDKSQPQYVSLVIDVTERRTAQDALQKAYDEMEDRVDARTEELVKANVALEHEITLRKRAEEELRNLSLRDPLTGLYNRRGFLALADQHLLQAMRDKKEFVLFFMDVDGLKQINDTLGHVRGDQALIKAGNALRDSFRKSDIIARIGGDEFAVVATEAREQHQKIYTNRLQENLERFNAEGHFPFLLSMSIGSCLFNPKKTPTIQELMTLADEDLYRFKRDRHQQGIHVIRAA